MTEEVVQVYMHYPQQPDASWELKAFRRVSIDKNKESVAVFRIPLSELQKWDIEKHAWRITKGSYQIVIGDNADENRLSAVVSIN
jgi:beta-glucosidase